MADPKNKWTQPGAPPAPMFFGKKERGLVKQINDELAERILGQPIAYYPISLEESNFNDTYGEATEKISLPPVRVYAYVTVENEQTNDRYGYDYQTKLTVNFSEKRLTADQNLYVRVGDFIQYGDLFYEIVRTYNDTRYYFGQVEHKFQISAECVRARQGAFRVTPALDRVDERPAISGESAQAAPRPAPYPPLAASYITVTPDRKLPNERVLTAGSGITIVDSGAGGAITVSAAGANAQGITGSLQLQAGGGNFSGSSNLVFLTSSNRLGINTDTPTHSLTILGDMSASINISASAFYGDGSNLSGITTTAGGSTTQIQFNNAGDFSGSNNLVFLTSSTRLGVGTPTPETTLHVSGTDGEPSPAFRISGTGPKLQFDENDGGAGRFQIQAANGMLKWQVQNSSFDAASVKWMMNSDGQMAFRDGEASAAIPARVYISGSGNSNLLQISSSVAPDILVVTGSGRVGIGTADPSHTFTVVGNISASINVSASAFYGDGGNLTNLPSAGLVKALNGSQAYLTSSLALGGALAADHTLSISGSMSASINVSASSFYGDGSNLTGVTASAVAVADGPIGSLQFREDIGGEISGSNKVLYDIANNRLTIAGGLIHNRTAITASHTASVSDYILGATALPSNILVDATLFSVGQVLLVKDETGTAASATPVTITPSGSQTVDGMSSLAIESPHGSVLVYSDGSNWFIY